MRTVREATPTVMSTKSCTSLTEAAVQVLAIAEPMDKVRCTRCAAAGWSDGRIAAIGDPRAPDRPSRPSRPALLSPRDLPRRRVSESPAGRIALLHALAHIELNAIDLAWDLIARSAGQDLPRRFFDDWVRVAAEEATHFALLSDRLAALGAGYGDLPAHDGLWKMAEATADDLLARLAVVPLVLEARGLDVTPGMIDRLRRAKDDASADVLEIIYRDEIGHVAVGKRWFDHLAVRQGLVPIAAWQALVRQFFPRGIKPPFNVPARAAAGFAAAYYAPLGDEDLTP